MVVMDMGYDDSNNVFSKNLGIFNYFLYTLQKIEFEGRFLYKIPMLAQCAPCNMYYVRSMYSHFLLTMWYTTTSATLVQWWITWKVRIEGLYGAVHKRCFFSLH